MPLTFKINYVCVFGKCRKLEAVRAPEKKKKMTLLWIISLLLTPINVEIENPKVFFLTYFGTTKMNNTFSSECHVSCQ